MEKRPSVLCIGGHDPTGGAGLQADIETVTGLGARAYSLVTCLTAQDTHNVYDILPTPVDFFRRQRDTLLTDLVPQVVKIGVIPTAAIAEVIAECLGTLQVPTVVDPILIAGGGATLVGQEVPVVLRETVLPHTTLLTPNRAEVLQIADNTDETVAAESLLTIGIDAVLVTGADAAKGDQVTNTLYRRDAASTSMRWPRLAGSYHGSGCTLASACAARLAAGDDVETAVAAAQQFTWQALQSAEAVGSGQKLPFRSR